MEVVLAVEVSLDERKLLGHPERLTSGEDRHLGDRVGIVRVRGNEGVSGLVDGDRVFFLG